MKKILLTSIPLLLWGCLQAQTPMITDGLIMPKKDFTNGVFYGIDSWKNYWEGTLKRDNQNIGTLTTQNLTYMGIYGLTDKVTLIGMLPYVWTKASGGTLHGMQGLQDAAIAAKYNFYTQDFAKSNVKFFALGSKNLSGRLTATYTLKEVWRFTASAAYTWRSNIYLDRSSYYTNGQLYYTNQVEMYDLFDFIVRAGYYKPKWHAEVYYTQQNTLGGGDIRRQDMPFASNQMNYSKIGVSVLYAVPAVKNLTARAWGNYTVAGRNVGQSTTINAGFLYTLHFSKPQP